VRAGPTVCAREIINGLDCAAEIAGYAVKFFHAIDAAKAAPAVLETPAPPPTPAAPDLSTVKSVQAALASLHFAIKVDGDAGPETQDVIKAFRAIVGLPAGTEADDATKAALAKALAL
jgi:peptidoglycan hydrolase-like protein with peptidoglycan-binding domain